MASAAIGVVSGIITIFNFGADLFPDRDTNSVKFRFQLGNDGARGRWGPLDNAGGAKPDTRVWSPVGDYLGIKINDGNKCQDGDIVCDWKIDGVRKAPDYAVFAANNDAICVAVAQTTYPSGEM